MKGHGPRAGRLAIGVVLFAGAALLCGCGEEDQRRAEREQMREQSERRAAEMKQAVRTAQEKREQDRRILEARRVEAESDALAALVAWASTALALVAVLALLCREHHVRKMLERLVNLLMNREERRSRE